MSSQIQHVTISIAGFAVAFTTDDPAVAGRLRQRYREFLAGDTPPSIHVALKLTPGALFIPITPGPWVIESSYDGGRLRYRSYRNQGEVEVTTGRGWLEMDPESNVENFLRVLYAWLCVTNGDLLLHAAGVIRQGEGYVFFGPSGAGKTTTSRLAAASGTVLSDDLVIIRRDGATGYRLYGVPFRGELSDAPRANTNAPLRGIFRLRKHTHHALEPMSPATAVAELMAAAPFVVGKPELSGPLFAVCRQLVAAVPPQQLHFRRDDGFWRVIDGFQSNVSPAASPNGR